MEAKLRVRNATSPEDFAQINGLRDTVFCVEQGFSSELIHNRADEGALGILLMEDHETLVGSGRITDKQEYAKLEAIVIAKDYRGKGHGNQLLLAMIDYSRNKGFDCFKLTGQARLSHYYEKHGFIKEGNEFVIEGCPHYWFSLSKNSLP